MSYKQLEKDYAKQKHVSKKLQLQVKQAKDEQEELKEKCEVL